MFIIKQNVLGSIVVISANNHSEVIGRICGHGLNYYVYKSGNLHICYFRSSGFSLLEPRYQVVASTSSEVVGNIKTGKDEYLLRLANGYEDRIRYDQNVFLGTLLFRKNLTFEVLDEMCSRNVFVFRILQEDHDQLLLAMIAFMIKMLWTDGG